MIVIIASIIILRGLRRLLNDDDRAFKIKQAIIEGELGNFLEGKFAKSIEYINKLTLHPSGITRHMVDELKLFFEDGEILEINQVVSYFCYANRTVLGSGVTTGGDILGLSPNESNDPNKWGHR